MLAFLKTFMYNTACRHDIGLSPSGKALDSDSSISGVRIPQAQLSASRIYAGGFLIYNNLVIIKERAGEAARMGVDYDRDRKNTVP